MVDEYDYNEIRGTYFNIIRGMTDMSIKEVNWYYAIIPFDSDGNRFSLTIENEWLNESLIIELTSGKDIPKEEIFKWMFGYPWLSQDGYEKRKEVKQTT